MKLLSLHPLPSRRRPRWKPSSLSSTVGLTALFLLCNGTADVSAFTTTSASCDGSGDGRCDSINNNARCDYDGGDCCEHSCSDGAAFSCGVVGYTCYDLSAPEYAELYYDDDDKTSRGWWSDYYMTGFIIILIAWCGVNKVCRERLLDRVYSGEARSGSASERSGFEESKKKTGALVFAWILLAVELGVAILLYLKGGGRISRQIWMEDPEYPLLPAEDTCVVGEGPQLVSYAAFYRCGVDVISQLVLWAHGEGLELPERAFVKALVVSINRCTGAASWSEHFSYETKWTIFLISGVSLHMLGPVIIDVLAICALGTTEQIMMFFGIIGMVVCCCNITCTLAPGEGGLLPLVDAVFNGVLGTWANVVQSGYILGAVFCVLPTFEIAFSIAELFVDMNTADLLPA